MKTTLKIAAAALTLVAATPVLAQQVDISTITCADAAAMDANALTLTIAFIDGYTGGEAGDTVLDIDRLGGDLDKVKAACEADATVTLMDAMKGALAAE